MKTQITLRAEELEPRIAPSGLAATLTTNPPAEQAHAVSTDVAAAAVAADGHGIVSVVPAS